MAINYTLNWSDDLAKPPFTLVGGTVDTTTTSLALTGKGFVNWGERVQENFLRLLENFAKATSPAYPTVGQLWYDTGNDLLMVYTTALVWVPVCEQCSGLWPTPAPTTTAPATTAPATTAPVTTGPATTAPATTAPATTAPVTTAPITTGPVTTSGSGIIPNVKIGDNGYQSIGVATNLSGVTVGVPINFTFTITNDPTSGDSIFNATGYITPVSNCTGGGTGNVGFLAVGGSGTFNVSITPTNPGSFSFNVQCDGLTSSSEPWYTIPNPYTANGTAVAIATTAAPTTAAPTTAAPTLEPFQVVWDPGQSYTNVDGWYPLGAEAEPQGGAWLGGVPYNDTGATLSYSWTWDSGGAGMTITPTEPALTPASQIVFISVTTPINGEATYSGVIRLTITDTANGREGTATHAISLLQHAETTTADGGGG